MHIYVVDSVIIEYDHEMNSEDEMRRYGGVSGVSFHLVDLDIVNV